MTERAQPTDLELAALISSKICHDVIGPVGAIYNGLEILDEDDDAEAKNYALDVIRNVTQQELSDTLGVDRVTVCDAVGQLKKRHLLDQRRRQIELLNPEGLLARDHRGVGWKRHRVV